MAKQAGFADAPVSGKSCRKIQGIDRQGFSPAVFRHLRVEECERRTAPHPPGPTSVTNHSSQIGLMSGFSKSSGGMYSCS